MSKVAGVDVLLKADVSGGSVQTIAGQTGATLSRNGTEIDVSDKTSDWKSFLVGMKEFSIEGEGFVSLGDTGQEALETVFEDRGELDVELRIGADSNADGVTYTGKVVITSMENSFGQEDAVTFSLSLKGTGALTRTVGTVV